MASPVRASCRAAGGPEPLPASVQAGSGGVSGGRSAAMSSCGPRGPGALLGFHGPTVAETLLDLAALAIPRRCGRRELLGSAGRVRNGPGSGSRADPEWKGLALRSEEVEGTSHWCVDCWGNRALA
ncbi:hypothetical protein NDU88_009356 [Pleurodeles waltl]|uniref:Uncharacterized protein n=1 Tax=Pleurodeles waltl TaxID=8319 RepID=A0AAV7QVJ9_PLEWA|nr:hypothetical protein NDU88_009356 [Pleurodeles waltl]